MTCFILGLTSFGDVGVDERSCASVPPFTSWNQEPLLLLCLLRFESKTILHIHLDAFKRWLSGAQWQKEGKKNFALYVPLSILIIQSLSLPRASQPGQFVDKGRRTCWSESLGRLVELISTSPLPYCRWVGICLDLWLHKLCKFLLTATKVTDQA